MMAEVKLPELGEGIETALILDVLVKPGDTIHDDDAIVEVESEKATAEIPSPLSGVVKEVRVATGGEVHVGDVLLTVETEATQAEEEIEPGAPLPPENRGPRQERTSVDAEAGEPERKEAARREGAPQEATQRAPSRDGESPVEPVESSRARKASPTVAAPPARVSASPSVRRFARELGIDLAEVPGTGPLGRIDEEDVKSHIRSLLEERARQRSEREDGLDAYDFQRFGAIERVEMNGIRRATAKAMTKAWRAVPMVTQFDRADLTALDDFRKKHSKEVEGEGGKLTITVMVLKVLGEALQRFPAFNASVDFERQELILKKYVHIGVAMDTGEGLLVPVLRDVNEKSLIDLAGELVELRRLAEARKLGWEELSGASSTLTNLGSLGTTYFTPIVTFPQTSVLGVGRALPEPIDRNGRIETRELLPLVVTYDHRAADGADAARFLRFIAATLESPFEIWLR